MTIAWSFSYNSFVKLHGKKYGSHNMTTLYLNLCYNEECYKGTAMNYLYLDNRNLDSIFNMGYLLSSANVFFFHFIFFNISQQKAQVCIPGMYSTYILEYWVYWIPAHQPEHDSSSYIVSLDWTENKKYYLFQFWIDFPPSDKNKNRHFSSQKMSVSD